MSMSLSGHTLMQDRENMSLAERAGRLLMVRVHSRPSHPSDIHDLDKS